MMMLTFLYSEGSAISTFQIPITNSSTAAQTFEFSMSQPGPNPSRQDAPHPHEVFTDPEMGYVLSPDLGMDLVHIYQVTGSGSLNECTPLSVAPGNGPRHGAWYLVPGTSNYVLYIVNELGNTVDSYPMNWGPGECISFNESTQVIAPYPAGKTIPSSANVAEIRSTGSHMFVSIRNDEAFGANNDSMAAITIDQATGHLSTSDISLTSSYGRTPRTFAVQLTAGLIAIGNQASSTVAIVEIDPTTGEPGQLLAELQVGPPGVPGQDNGLSSVIWRQ
jgi:6-phosphogluconolactonase (cycloisomerase 2 family)